MKLNVAGVETYVYTGTKTWKPEQPWLLFIHGAANDHSVWALQSRYFAHHGWNVVAPDLPGHGLSGGALLTSIEAIARWCETLLNTCDAVSSLEPLSPRERGRGEGATSSSRFYSNEIQQPASLTPTLPQRERGPISVIGHSMGSLAAIALAGNLSARCERLALLGCAAPMGVSDALLDAAKNQPDLAYKMIVNWSFAPIAHTGGNKAPGMWMTGQSLALMRRAKAGVLHQDLLNCKSFSDNSLQSAPQVSGKVLCVSGNKDLMTPAKSVAPLVAALKANSNVSLTTHTLNDCGHSMMSERPEEVLAALKGLLK
jgi:pimeloyl-ACP methyl ester carboxylesterase